MSHSPSPAPFAPAVAYPRGGWRALALAFAVVYLADSHLRDFLLAGGVGEWLAGFATAHLLTLNLTFLVYAGFMTAASYALLWRFYGSEKPGRTIAVILGVAVAGIGLRAVLEEGLVRAAMGVGNYKDGVSWAYYIRDNTLYALIYVGLGTVTFFLQHGRLLETRRLRSEAAARRARLDHLRAQVNPHFLFNALNSVYALVYQGSERALPVLERLSDLLRYTLYEEGARVPVAREVAQIRNLMAVEEVRLAGARAPELTVDPAAESVLVPPLLLLPFVENVFKHGDLRSGTAPARICIGLTAKRALCATFENTLPAAPRTVAPRLSAEAEAGGIGVANVRHRLRLLYPGRHRLEAGVEGGVYRVRLQLAADA